MKSFTLINILILILALNAKKRHNLKSQAPETSQTPASNQATEATPQTKVELKHFYEDEKQRNQNPNQCSFSSVQLQSKDDFSKLVSKAVEDSVTNNVANSPFKFIAFNYGTMQLGGMQHPQDYAYKAQTAVFDDDLLPLRIGGNYTHDSQKFNEFQITLNKIHETLHNSQFKVLTLEEDGYESKHLQDCQAGGSTGMGCSHGAATFPEGGPNYHLWQHVDFTGLPVTPEIHEEITKLVQSGKVISHCTGGTGRTAYGLGTLMLNYLASSHKDEFIKAYEAGLGDDKVQVYILSADNFQSVQEISDFVNPLPNHMLSFKKFQDKLTDSLKTAIQAHDNLVQDGLFDEKYIKWMAPTNVFTADLVRAIRCIYKFSALETGSQVRGLQGYAKFLYDKAKAQATPVENSPASTGSPVVQRFSKFRKHKKHHKSIRIIIGRK